MGGHHGKANARNPSSGRGNIAHPPGKRASSKNRRMDRLAVIQGDALLHYTDCGLDYIWLSNGFEHLDTECGRATQIKNREGLHAAIGRAIVNGPSRLRGQEVRYLRSMLGLSQEGLGKLLRQSRATVARWEGERTKPIPSGSDQWLRVVYTRKAEGDESVCKLVDLLTELDDLCNGQPETRDTRFKAEEGRGWVTFWRTAGCEG